MFIIISILNTNVWYSSLKALPLHRFWDSIIIN